MLNPSASAHPTSKHHRPLCSAHRNTGRKTKLELDLCRAIETDHITEWSIVAGLKASATLRDYDRGSAIHAEVVKLGFLESNVLIGSALVDTYAKCGVPAEAKEVLKKLSRRDVVSWTCLISAYADLGHSEEAIGCFDQMQREGVSPDAVTYVCCLKACGARGLIGKGKEMHTEIEMKGLLNDNAFIASALVDMYAKCGSLLMANHVFDRLPMPDAVTWNALIAGYIKQGHGKKAIEYLEQMQQKSVSPNVVTFLSIIKACGNHQAIDKGQELCAKCGEGFVGKNIAFGNALICMYGKCGFVEKAFEVFNRLSGRDVVSWNTLILEYLNHDEGSKVVQSLSQMQMESVLPNNATLTCGLKACVNLDNIFKGFQIHAGVEKEGVLDTDIILGSAVVGMYAKCGAVSIAQEVFDYLPVRDVISWTELISGYSERGHGKEALGCYEQMEFEAVPPNAATFIAVLKACSSIGLISRVQQIHADIERHGFLENDLAVGSTLVDVYARYGFLYKAHQVFDSLAVRNVVSWTSLIGGHVEYCEGHKALLCYEMMQLEGVYPNALSLVCCLKACHYDGALGTGQAIHIDCEKLGILEHDPFISNTLVNMYAKYGLLVDAQEVFDKIQVRTQIAWNALITGYCEHSHGEEVLECLKQMQLDGVRPNAITYTCTLKACCSLGMLAIGQQLHDEVQRSGLDNDLFIGNTLLNMYARYGMFGTAEQLFDKLEFRNGASWNALILGYAEHGYGEEVLKCLERMQLEGVSPDGITFIGCFKACGAVGSGNKGEELHSDAERKGFLESATSIGNSLIHMYAKGDLQVRAQNVFDRLQFRDVVSWTALMAGYIQTGESGKVFCIFDQMLNKHVKPDPITFTVVLTACSRIGFLCLSQTYFDAMCEKHGILPTLEHETCMVDLLGRIGEVRSAVDVMNKNPFSTNIVTQLSMLGACRSWGNIKLGELVFKANSMVK